MRRLDWQLVPPLRPDSREGPVVAEALRRHHEALAAPDAAPSDEDRLALAALEERYEEETLPPCEAVDAPVVEDDPDWQTRVLDEFASADVEGDLEEYLDMRRKEPDCDRCPYASPYSLFPQDPCEFSAGLLEELLRGETELAAALSRPTAPEGMRTLAERLDRAAASGRVAATDAVDVADYVAKATMFLRFWADRGYGIWPIDPDAESIPTVSLGGDDGDTGDAELEEAFDAAARPTPAMGLVDSDGAEGAASGDGGSADGAGALDDLFDDSDEDDDDPEEEPLLH